MITFQPSPEFAKFYRTNDLIFPTNLGQKKRKKNSLNFKSDKRLINAMCKSLDPDSNQLHIRYFGNN